MKSPVDRTLETRGEAVRRARSRRRADDGRRTGSEIRTGLSRPALYRIDSTAEQEAAVELLATFAERERRRTLHVAARLAAGEIQTRLRRVSLVGFLEGLRRRFLPYALSRRIAFSVTEPEVPCSCLASDEILEAMTRALIWNALECVPTGAVVRVAAAIDPATQTAKIEIRDNGPLLAPEEWEAFRERLHRLARPSELFDLPRPEFALAMQLAEMSGIALRRRDRPATNFVEAIVPLRPRESVLSHLARRSVASGAGILSAFSLEAAGVSSEDAITIEEIGLGSLPANSLLWRMRLDRWVAVAPATPLEWFDWYRRFAAALHLERIRTGRSLPTPNWTYRGAWPATADAQAVASLIDALTSEEGSRHSAPAVTVPMHDFRRIDEAQEALRLLGYRRFRQEASEWGEVRIVAERS
jgi:hypothetical protein